MNLQTARKILLCLRYGIGDVVMQLPAIEALRQAAPAAPLSALGAEPAVELLAGDRRVDRLLSVQRWGFDQWGDTGTPASREEVRRWLENERFDLVLDPSHAVRGVGQVIWDVHPPILDTGSRSQDEALARGVCGVEAVKAAARSGWGIEIPTGTASRLEFTPAEQTFAGEFLREQQIVGSPVGLSPVASSFLKRWPTERFFALAGRLTAAGFDLLLFTGTEAGFADFAEMRQPGAGRIVPVGPLHLRKIAALLAACRLFIGNDTGLMHMAAAAGTPLVALFGPTSPDIYLPEQVPAVALGGRDPCRWRRTVNFGPPPCVAENHCFTSTRGCIEKIEVADVWQAIGGHFDTQPAPSETENRLWPT
jgi:ADP-heptose:LPS heptosyltransferase